MRLLDIRQDDFKSKWKRFLKSRENLNMEEVEERVRTIFEEVKRGGDKAILELSGKYDKVDLKIEGLRINRSEMRKAFEGMDSGLKESLTRAKERIYAFHKASLKSTGGEFRKNGIVAESRIIPVERVGIYAPGGKAIYPSTVLMTAIPATTAGVGEIYLATPPGKEGPHPVMLATAYMAGVKCIFQVGGAQAIAAFALGTNTIPRVDKVVGPGNIFVTCAKKIAVGWVGIDSLAGPTEVVVLSDGSIPPSFAASDLISQAEHDEMATPILISPSKRYIEKVHHEIRIELKSLYRNTAKEALRRNGMSVWVRNVNEGIRLVNEVAPEHLCLFVRNAEKHLEKIRNAGAIFIGPYSPVALGDYMAGPNHVLPTSATARFASPLGVKDFLKEVNVISSTRDGLRGLSVHIKRLAELEGLPAHTRSVEIRLEPGVRNKWPKSEIPPTPPFPKPAPLIDSGAAPD